MGRRDASVARVRQVCRCAVLALGALQALGGGVRQAMNPDGVAYLDIGDAYLRGDWSAAVNSYWSPLYSWVLGVVIHAFSPSMRWEFPTVHLVNFAIYTFALICFERFWSGLDRWRHARADIQSVLLPDWLWLPMGYSVFAYATLNLIRVWSVTPDMLVAGFVFLAADFMLRIRNRAATWRTAMSLGIVLGLGYLAKTAMFPLAFVFLAAIPLAAAGGGRATRFLLVAMAGFLLVAAPYVLVLSAVRGRVTFGDTGRLMYAWHVNAVPHPHWQGEVPEAGTPAHGSRRIFNSPAIYEFGRPAHGTYPIAYDPVYWYEGVQPHFEWKGQVRVLAMSGRRYLDVFGLQLGGVLVCIAALLCSNRPRGLAALANGARECSLALIAIAALCMFAVVHVQGRYIGPFVVLFVGNLLASVRVQKSTVTTGRLSSIGTLMLLVLMINVGAFMWERGGRILESRAMPGVSNAHVPAAPRSPGEIADALREIGVRAGDSVGVIGYAFDAYWARLARVQIVAEMFDDEAGPFWFAETALRSRVVGAFAATGAKAIVAERVPPDVTLTGWHRIGSSSFYVYKLDGPDPVASTIAASAR